MAKDLSQYFEALEAFRQRARAALAPARAELAAWFRDFFKRRKGPARTTHLMLLRVAFTDTPRPRWEFSWYPGMHSRDVFVTLVQPVPVLAAEADARAVGLPAADLFMLHYCAYQDATAEAWELAGGDALPKELMMLGWGYNVQLHWVEDVREMIRKEAEGTRYTRPRWGLGPPEPLGLPVVPGELTEAVRNGAPTALTNWADALDRAGATDAAGLLRWLPRFHASIAEEVAAVSPQFGFAITVKGNGYAWWWIGDMCSECDNADSRQLGRIMAAWNETQPAVEWLLRQFRFPHAVVEAIRHATDENVPTKKYDLTAGQHLEPVADDVRVLKLDVPGWEPIEGDLGG